MTFRPVGDEGHCFFSYFSPMFQDEFVSLNLLSNLRLKKFFSIWCASALN